MKHIISGISLAIIIVVILYAGCAFAVLSFDPHNWNEVLRYMFSMFSVLILTFVPFAYCDLNRNNP